MSSKVFPPDDPRVVAPVVWRQVHGAADPPETTREEPESSARLDLSEQQCEERVRQARAAGMREGEAAGRQAAGLELQPVIARLARSIEELATMRPRLRREAEADVVKLSLAVARRVLRRELAVDPDALHGLVVAALEKLQSQEISRVKVHPSHAALVTACLQQAISGAAVEVIPHASFEPGAIIFETQRGNLDASVDSQLQEIERGLTDRLRKLS
jgi:flagellar assembly protein FliH